MPSAMTRYDVIQAVLDAIGGRRYLEIGVFQRETFDRIAVQKKTGVDPYYFICPSKNLYEKILGRLPSCHKLFNRLKGERFFQMTSDCFFKKHAEWLRRNPPNVCFIDGLHTYSQSLTDVLNMLKYLSGSGIIVMHDCSPASSAMACAAASLDDAAKMKLPGWTGEWCGDVWKTIVYLRSQCEDLQVFVLNTDYGIGIITRGKPEGMLTYSRQEIELMTYNDLDNKREKLLNLKESNHLKIFLKSLTSPACS